MRERAPGCREACLSCCLAFHHLHLLLLARDTLPSSSPCVQWSVEYPPTSICLTSLSLSPTVAAPALQRLSQNLPWPLLCPHSSHLVRACPPWSHKAPSPRPSPLLTRLARPHTAVPIPLPPSVDLSSSLTAELLDWTTSPHLLRLPPPLSPDCCIHRTTYKASRASVFTTQKGKSIFRVVCPLEPCRKHTSDPGLELDLETLVLEPGKSSSNACQ